MSGGYGYLTKSTESKEKVLIDDNGYTDSDLAGIALICSGNLKFRNMNDAGVFITLDGKLQVHPPLKSKNSNWSMDLEQVNLIKNC